MPFPPTPILYTQNRSEYFEAKEWTKEVPIKKKSVSLQTRFHLIGN